MINGIQARRAVLLAALTAAWLPPARAQTQLLANPGFEAAPFLAGWTATNVTSNAGLNGSAASARLPYNTNSAVTAILFQAVATAQSNFSFEFLAKLAGVNEAQCLEVRLSGPAGDVIALRTAATGLLQLGTTNGWVSFLSATNGAAYGFQANKTNRVAVNAFNLGTASGRYEVAWSNPGSTNLAWGATNLTRFAAAGGPVQTVTFLHANGNYNSYNVDSVLLYDAPGPAAPATHTNPPPPAPDRIVRISGIYPHLAMTTGNGECGTGAVVPWADRLWVMTYGPHQPTGSSDKLYEIDTNLVRVTRPESIGGTPANRMIHQESGQLIMGPYFIDSNRTVRAIPYAIMPGRHTATTRHLSDPANQVHYFTMEDGVYNVDVHSLAVTTNYPDVQGTGDAHMPGYHGKGAYASQGLLVAANNGESTQTYPSGVLATWDGALPHTWTTVYRYQFCEVTGPGGLRGNSPGDDRLWALGFDPTSVRLVLFQGGQWRSFRLPKGSYTHDAPHGWYTEWPRIRQVGDADWLMHMHGLFYRFPPTFCATNTGGLEPLARYHKMPVDYCAYGDGIVMGKNDSSMFNNAFVPFPESNLWFGRLSDFADWGQPCGFGGVWLNEAVAAGSNSEPFLVRGFARGTLHLRHSSTTDVQVAMEADADGSGNWAPVASLTLPATGYAFHVFAAGDQAWLRLRPLQAASNLTAYFHLTNPYPHATPPSRGTGLFDALADIDDAPPRSEGIVRIRNDSALLNLEFASTTIASNGAIQRQAYHRLGGPLELENIADATAESALRSAIGLTNAGFWSDAASLWITQGVQRLRLPRYGGRYDAAFTSGWPRAFREVVTERELLNCGGTFYEVPRSDAGGRRRLQPLATHGKRISDFCSWRGLLALAGVASTSAPSDHIVRAADGQSALWLGEVDDLWRLGEPRGVGGPWKNSAMTSGVPSDPYLMAGYDRKVLELSHAATGTVRFAVQVDFLGDNTWSDYGTLDVPPGQVVTSQFPTGYSAHWVRLVSDTTATGTATFVYGPMETRDRFLDWMQSNGFNRARGRGALAADDADGDGIPALIEYALGSEPDAPSPAPQLQWERTTNQPAVHLLICDDPDLAARWETSTNLVDWLVDGSLHTSASSPGNPGFFDHAAAFPTAPNAFGRWRFQLLFAH